MAHTWSAGDPQVFDLRTGGRPLEQVVDLGDLDGAHTTMDAAQQELIDVVRGLPDGVVPAVLGGDHTVTAAVIDGLFEADPTRSLVVVQFDHHLDLQIWDGAPGEAAPVREALFNTNVMSHVSDRIGSGRLVQVGVSPYATVEASCSDAFVTYLSAIGTQIPVLSEAISDPLVLVSAVGASGDVYVTVDLDVLEVSAMSSTAYPSECGLRMVELLTMIDTVLAKNRLVGFDVVEFSAERSARDKTTIADAGRAVMIVLHLLGWVQSQVCSASQE